MREQKHGLKPLYLLSFNFISDIFNKLTDFILGNTENERKL